MLSQNSEDEFDQDLCLNLWYELKKLHWQDELNPRVRCAFGNVFVNFTPYVFLALSSIQDAQQTNKLVKVEYFQEEREAPEKAAAQRWIHKTHK